jgi:hypothetical protein
MEETLSQLSVQAGIDLNALRAKYKKKDHAQEKFNTITSDITAAPSISASDDFRVLDKYVICKTCNGSGFIKELYNHRWLEKNCPECEGDSIVLDKAVAAIAESNAEI